jgi:hypothetical protein
MTLDVNCANLLVELGRTDEALQRVRHLAKAAEASGDTHSLCELRAIDLAIRLARGEQAGPGEVDWLVETARTISASDVTTFVFASAAAAIASEEPERVRALLDELDRVPGAHENPYYPRYLPGMVRTALAVRDSALAARLAEGVARRYPVDDHALCAARAQIAEHEADHAAAARLYEDAASRWREFDNVAERAYALLGQGRSLVALGRAGAAEPLREACELFASMDYAPTFAEARALLDQTAAATA